MGRSSSTKTLEGDLTNLTNKPKSTMFRFVALFALVAVALAEPEADAQVFVNPYNTVGVNGVPLVNTYTNVVNPVVPVVKPVVPVVKYTMPVAKAPVVKYMNPHHTEGMTKQGVPEKTASVKIAEKQHELAKEIEKVTKVQYVAPYTTYAHAGFPYVHHPVAAHVIAKREADSDADPAVFYNTYGSIYPYAFTYTGYPYTTAVAGYPYTTGYTYSTPVVHHLGKREADSDAALYYKTYGYNYGSPYTYSYGTPYTYNAFPYRNVYGWY